MPPPRFFPSVVTNLRVRFDEALHGVPIPAPQDLDSPDSVLSLQRGQLAGLSAARSDQLTGVFRALPMRAHIEIGSYRMASKFSLEFQWDDFPFEPDVVRAIDVEIYAGCVDDAAWASGNVKTPPAGTARTTQLRQLVLADALLVGRSDTVSVEHSAAKGATVKIEGRDLRGTLIDLQTTPGVLTGLNVGRPIDDVVKQIINKVAILKHHPGGPAGITVSANPDDWPDGKIPAPNAPDAVTRIQLGSAGAPAGEAGANPTAMQQPGTVQGMKLWDLITNFCALVGAVPYFVGRDLRIRPARALYDSNKLSAYDPRFATPFAGGTPRLVKGVDGANHLTPIRVLTYGKDLAKLTMERKTAGIKLPVVRVISLDTDAATRGVKNKIIDAQFPPIQGDALNGIAAQAAINATKTSVTANGAVAQSEPIIVFKPGIKSKKRLAEIAEDIYEEIGRGEITGSAATADLASLGGDAADPDLLRLRPGDPVSFQVDHRALRSYPPAVADLPNLLRLPVDQMATLLGRKLGDDVAGRVLAYSLAGRIAERQQVYRVSEVTFSWDSAKGIGVDFKYQNYIESRAGITSARNRSAANARRKPAVR